MENETAIEYVDVLEAADILNCHFNTIYNYRREGKLNAIQRGNKLMFERAEVEALARAKPQPVTDSD